MTPEQKTLIKESWRQVVPVADTAAGLFYDRLFKTHPEIGRLFEGVDIAEQGKRLIGALDRVVSGLDRIEDLLPDLRAMGRRHAGYGVREAHFDAVGAALLWTLEQGLGAAWTPEMRAAWAQAYDAVAGVMQAAMAEAPDARHGLGPVEVT